MISTLTCPHRELIAVAERVQPNVECYRHGNLPDVLPQTQYAASESSPALIATKKNEGVVSMELKIYQSTRVDVDARGRRMLVNDMR
jgi:hypothetical protein